eukprot:1090342-Rhodomonas_salina.1
MPEHGVQAVCVCASMPCAAPAVPVHGVHSSNVRCGTRCAGDIVREERDKVLELLLSQERVISLLYEKTFPVRSALSSYGGPRVLSRAGREPGAESEDGGSLAGTAVRYLPTRVVRGAQY